MGGITNAYHSGHRQENNHRSHNYQKKLDELNSLIMSVTKDDKNKKTFKGYIDEIWKECMENSDKCIVTGKAPARKDK